MKFGVYSVYDEKACFFAPPFCAKTDGEAARMFDSAVRDSGSAISMYPSDFSLYRIGTFSDGDASLDADIPIVLLSRGSEHIKVSG